LLHLSEEELLVPDKQLAESRNGIRSLAEPISINDGRCARDLNDHPVEGQFVIKGLPSAILAVSADHSSFNP
jgi:hypothetical protein